MNTIRIAAIVVFVAHTLSCAAARDARTRMPAHNVVRFEPVTLRPQCPSTRFVWPLAVDRAGGGRGPIAKPQMRAAIEACLRGEAMFGTATGRGERIEVIVDERKVRVEGRSPLAQCIERHAPASSAFDIHAGETLMEAVDVAPVQLTLIGTVDIDPSGQGRTSNDSGSCPRDVGGTWPQKFREALDRMPACVAPRANVHARPFAARHASGGTDVYIDWQGSPSDAQTERCVRDAFTRFSRQDAPEIVVTIMRSH